MKVIYSHISFHNHKPIGVKYLLYSFVCLLLFFPGLSLQGQDCEKTSSVFSATLDPSKTFIANDWGVEGLWNQDGEYVILGIKDDKNNSSKFGLFFERFGANGNPLGAT